MILDPHCRAGAASMREERAPSAGRHPRTRGAVSRIGLRVGCRQDAATGLNDVTVREAIWQRFSGDDWAAFDALPPAIRQRMQDHAYDAWAVNALMLWQAFRRRLGSSACAERRLLNYLGDCEALERAAFAEAYRQAHGRPLPHVASGATVLRSRR
ncbi:DUF6525 family protein [Falsiroseomonas sp. HC035]|uniref:DUF6525 family protein n=1 Tax=Falsiroseomonas sp. HC035 TaxID=3390999 RepID=UPI003D3230A8